MPLRAFLAAFLALLLAASPAQARETIRHFHADYAIQPDGSMQVVETIRVRAEGREIKRGIFRTIPTRYRDRDGSVENVRFRFLGAERNGRREEAKVTRQSNGMNIRLGSADTFLTPGEHSYKLRYTIERAVGRFDAFDELYWNVTGNDTTFPIERASATIRLPTTAPGGFIQSSSYTGRVGSAENNARITRQDDRQIRFETTRGLAPREGLTVAAAFPKGVVTPLSNAEQLERRLADHAPPIAALLGLLLVVGYYVHAWRTVGRDPRAGPVVPLFAPPDDLSPAAIRYLTRQTMDHRGMTAALVDCAIKGHVELSEKDAGLFKTRKMTIHRLDPTAELRAIGKGEQRMLAELARPGQSIEMDNDHHEAFSAARKALEKPYEDHYLGKAFHRNLGWAFAGMLFLIAGIWLAAAGVVWAEEMAHSSQILLSVAGVTVGALFFLGRPDRGDAFRWPIIILALVIGSAGLLLGLPFVPLAAASGNFAPVLVPMIGGGLIALSGFFWMDAPTPRGRAMLDRIAGFKQYLETTEQERFDRMQSPREQLKLFERYLPHAIALGVENRWASRFEDVLAAAAAAPSDRNRDQGFVWYHGSRDIWSNPTGFATAIGASMTSTIASASSAPGSSSGSGGGGFSGGGGGGGGVGGW
ncbi:DUF2207 domain-containing protein [Sphingomicrobium arenosum]|uniref:DUF2207 domain-containing protein n=1 Tax=Sphingomicrobium arenosum TaxID=2233861 RepID=UPI00223FB12E|nr:DUF2207 domain-containing protein [Sphingomicrobium arenosum]